MTFTQLGRLQSKRGTESGLAAANPTLLSGEMCVETDTGKFKIGPGAWSSLSYAGGGGGSQTLANTSNSTSHTVTLSGSGGSLQLVEGANVTLTTTGTSGAGVVTIASTGGGGGTSVTIAEDTTEAMVANTTYVCPATAENFAVTLTTAGLSAGDVVTFVFPAANANLVTLSCAAGLAGSTTRVMRNGESAVLRWSGSTFDRVGGINIPFIASMRLSASTPALASGTEHLVPLNVALIDQGYGTVNTSTSRMTFPRGGSYELSLSTRLFDTPAGTARQTSFFRLNSTAGTYENNAEVSFPTAGAYPYIKSVAQGMYNAGDYIDLRFFHSGADVALSGGGPGTSQTSAGFKEQPSW